MSKHRIFASVAVLVALFFAGAVNPIYANNYGKEAKKLDKEIKQLTKKKQKQEKEKSRQESLLRKKNKEIQSLEDKQTKVSAQVKEQKQAVLDLQNKIAAEQTLKAKTTEELTALVSSTYRWTQLDYIKLLLSQQNPHEMIRSTDYFRYLARARDQRISALKLSINGLDETGKELQSKLQTLEKTQKKFDQQQKTLQQKNVERKQLITRLGTDIDSADKKLKKLKQNQARLTKLIAKLNKERKKQTRKFVPTKGGFAKQKGRMLFPIAGKTTQRFGARIKNSQLSANGMSIRIADKADVQAIFDGQVIFAGWLKGFGNLIIVDHGNGYMSLYGNNDVLYKQVGQVVNARDVVASTAPKQGKSDFYFEIRYNGKPIDPNKWCRS